MPVNRCRVCGNLFFEEPLLILKNMPKSAQYLPTKEDIANDRGLDLEVYQCSGCGLVQLNSDPVHYYKEVIRASGFSNEMKEFRIKQFNGFTEKYNLKGKKVIEIGCGRGEYLSLMRGVGADAYGLEYSDEGVKICQEKGLKVIKGFIEDSGDKIDNTPFDGFYMLNFLEHLPNPNRTLRGIYNNLKDNAFGLVEVPNFDMILKKNLFSEFISDHLFYFTKETLTTLLRLNGFEIIECKEIWYDYIISATVKKSKRMNISYFYKHQKLLKKEIEEFINKFGAKKVAIWGAGHQALAVISLMYLADKIKYVIDSAPFKQGRYTPATHLPIVSPDTINSDPVDAVIIIAGSYSDEVAKIIQSYKNIHVAILRDFGLEIF